jgi:hypothetical protein
MSNAIIAPPKALPPINWTKFSVLGRPRWRLSRSHHRKLSAPQGKMEDFFKIVT